MDEKEYLYRGWDFAAKLAGTDFAANDAENYVSEVQKAIEDLEKGIRDLKSNQTDASLGGFLAEEWHARTFNIDAIADGSAHRAVRLGDTGYGSVDIDTNFDQQYSSKYMATPEKSATEQALVHRDTGEPLYKGQNRLVPQDHLDKAVKHAHHEAARNADTRPDVCMYSGDTISIDQLKTDKVYNIDHIYPKCVIKDDRVANNKVLVKADILLKYNKGIKNKTL